MPTRPDSALHLLENISADSLKTKADSAYFALLLTQARDKNYILQKDDSLIRTAVTYYDSTEEITKQAQAYYQWGNVYRDQREYPTAINRYLMALSCISPPDNGALHSTLYSNIAYLYYIQGLNNKADSVYRQAELLATQQKDTIALCYALTQQGMICLEKGKKYYPKAEQQMLQAMSIGKAYSDNTVLRPIYSSLSALYNTIPDTVKALKYSRLNYYTKTDTAHCYRAFLYLGNAYFLNAQYDSASIFLRKILTADKYYDTKADAYMRLSEIALRKGDTDSAILMERRRAACLDSVRISQPVGATTLKVIPYERESGKAFQKRYSSYIIIGIPIILLIISGWSILNLIKRNKKYRAEKKKWREKHRKAVCQITETTERLTEQQQQNLLLQEKVKQLAIKNEACAIEEYNTSPVYIKIRKIAKELIRTETKENLSEKEWSRFIELTNARWNGIISYLIKEKNLQTEEIQICCLYLAKVPEKHIGHFVNGKVRSSIQLKAKEIREKINYPQMPLGKALAQLAEKLKNEK